MNGFDLYRSPRGIDGKVKFCFLTDHEVYYKGLKKNYPTLNVGS